MGTTGGRGVFYRPDRSETKKSGRRFARGKEGDEIVTATPAQGDVVSAITRQGKLLSFKASQLPELSGPGRGVILMRTDDDDAVVSALCHPRKARLLALGSDGAERQLERAELAQRSQKGRRAVRKLEVAELRLADPPPTPPPAESKGSGGDNNGGHGRQRNLFGEDE